MLTLIFGSALMFFFADEGFEKEVIGPSTIVYSTQLDSRLDVRTFMTERPVAVQPLVVNQYRNVVHQAYDYSCGSAALTTLMNGYLGHKFDEKQILDGLLKFGEYDKIVERRGFSLLDMKRLMTALGYSSGGFKGSFEDLKKIEHPAIVPIHYGGFKHFVVLKKYKDGRVFVADPALGNISFPAERFKTIWENNVMFIVFPAKNTINENKLELAEEDMRFVDDKTINLAAFSQAPLFIKQSQENMERAATLQRVFDADKNSDTYDKPIDVPLRSYYRKK